MLIGYNSNYTILFCDLIGTIIFFSMFVILYMHCTGTEENIYGVPTEIASGLYNLQALNEVFDDKRKSKNKHEKFKELCNYLLNKLTKAKKQLIEELHRGTYVCICNSCNTGKSALPKYMHESESMQRPRVSVDIRTYHVLHALDTKKFAHII